MVQYIFQAFSMSLDELEYIGQMFQFFYIVHVSIETKKCQEINSQQRMKTKKYQK